MSKARIVSNQGDGFYTVEIVYHQEYIQEQIDRLAQEIIDAVQPILDKKLEIQAQQDRVDELADDLRQATIEHGLDVETLLPFINELAKAQADLQKLEFQLNTMTARDAVIKKQKTWLENARDGWQGGGNFTIPCADYTTDIAPGTEVALALVPGENAGAPLVIQPGYTGGHIHEPATDGNLTPPLSQGKEAFFWNWAMLPGWQRWQPEYRHAEIEAIDKGANTCTIYLEAARSSVTRYLGSVGYSTGLNVNRSNADGGRERFYDVPIEYMDCNAGPFLEGDRVLVQFNRGGAVGNAAWENPKVIGFVEGPKSCGDTQFLLWVTTDTSPVGLGDPGDPTEPGFENQAVTLYCANAQEDLFVTVPTDLGFNNHLISRTAYNPRGGSIPGVTIPRIKNNYLPYMQPGPKWRDGTDLTGFPAHQIYLRDPLIIDDPQIDNYYSAIPKYWGYIEGEHTLRANWSDDSLMSMGAIPHTSDPNRYWLITASADKEDENTNREKIVEIDIRVADSNNFPVDTRSKWQRLNGYAFPLASDDGTFESSYSQGPYMNFNPVSFDSTGKRGIMLLYRRPRPTAIPPYDRSWRKLEFQVNGNDGNFSLSLPSYSNHDSLPSLVIRDEYTRTGSWAFTNGMHVNGYVRQYDDNTVIIDQDVAQGLPESRNVANNYNRNTTETFVSELVVAADYDENDELVELVFKWEKTLTSTLSETLGYRTYRFVEGETFDGRTIDIDPHLDSLDVDAPTNDGESGIVAQVDVTETHTYYVRGGKNRQLISESMTYQLTRNRAETSDISDTLDDYAKNFTDMKRFQHTGGKQVLFMGGDIKHGVLLFEVITLAGRTIEEYRSSVGPGHNSETFSGNHSCVVELFSFGDLALTDKTYDIGSITPESTNEPVGQSGPVRGPGGDRWVPRSIYDLDVVRGGDYNELDYAADNWVFPTYGHHFNHERDGDSNQGFNGFKHNNVNITPVHYTFEVSYGDGGTFALLWLENRDTTEKNYLKLYAGNVELDPLPALAALWLHEDLAQVADVRVAATVP